jgi:hypothetical protein
MTSSLSCGFSLDDCLLESETMGVRNKAVKAYTSIGAFMIAVADWLSLTMQRI